MIPKHWLQGGQRMKNSWSWCVCPETRDVLPREVFKIFPHAFWVACSLHYLPMDINLQETLLPQLAAALPVLAEQMPLGFPIKHGAGDGSHQEVVTIQVHLAPWLCLNQHDNELHKTTNIKSSTDDWWDTNSFLLVFQRPIGKRQTLPVAIPR